SAHVLAQAILRLYPEALPTIGPPIAEGFYYDFANLSISEDDFPIIEKEIQKIIKENHQIERHVFKDKKEAIDAFKNNPYKKALIESFEDTSELTGYKQGEFFDLCRGPHLYNLGKIKAFKLLKTSGAYWRGDAKNEMLTRIYGISFPDRLLLKDYLHFLSEAKKRDHRVIGNKLSLFSFREEAPGMPIIHPKGMIIWESLLDFWKDLHRKAGYEVIKTPQMMSKELWVRSGHWQHYRENMYLSSIDDKEFAIKPMNCPGCMLYYRTHKHSYRELPLKIAEIGHVHRHEPSGAINGMFRVRSFHQDDAHVFMKPSDIKQEIIKVLELSKKLYEAFGLKYSLELSTRPEKSIGTDADWEMTTKGLQEALETWGAPYRINEGDGAFYGPKIDIHIHDAIGRAWQCGTIQLDMSLPEKFDLEYTDKDGEAKRPIMIHRAIFGSIERFFGILIEHFAGKFPLWMSPNPLRIIPVSDKHLEYAKKIKSAVDASNIYSSIDETNESVSKKIRNAQIDQVNYMLTIGDQEIEQNTISLRTRDNVVHGEMKLQEFLSKIVIEYKSRAQTSPYTKEK
ncbi:MAG: threonine--tRNA ligase, partial [Simkaniaceae bacterium]|nr:threonine--tRNA ligase [Simkaniaceae bacterium]